MSKKYDIGILGVWSGCNYGSIMTYYALNRLVEGMGKSVLMIDKPILKSGNDVEKSETHSRRFANEHYNISPSYRISDYGKYNDMCDGFLLGSDQLWNYGISKNFGKSFYLDFAKPDKRKVAYATSFGHEIDFAPFDERKIITKYMRDFNAISLREDDGVKICSEVYGVEAQQVLDPVFMVDRKEIYDPLIKKSSHYKPENKEEPFICAYILDPTPEKREALLKLSEKLGGIKIICLLDGLFWLFNENKKKMNLENCIEDVQVEDWLYYISRARYVVTDSCHGASFAMIFGREFTAITNKRRGFSRFHSLGNLFDCHDRIITDVSKIITDDSLLNPVDYKKINSIMKRERKRCKEWIKNALNCPIEEKVKPIELEYEKPQEPIPVDYSRCKTVAAVLNQYGVSDVVVSSGKRYLPFVKCIESEPLFRTHNVADERSAGYYALGLAQKTKKPVVLCSDAPAEGFIEAVKSAKENNIRLIVITADTKNEIKDFEIAGIQKINIPDGDTQSDIDKIRFDVCMAMVSSKQNGGQPVQINIPLSSSENEKIPKPSRLRIDTRYRTIEFVSSDDSDEVWKAKANRLKQLHRVLLIYGASKPLTDREKEAIDKFSENYNVAVITNVLSNYNGKYSVSAANILKSFDSQKFNDRLWADSIITVGGEIPLEELLENHINNLKKPHGHWSVGHYTNKSDPYKSLMRIFDCSPEHFFDMFNRFAEGSKNDGVYYNKWKKAESDCKFADDKNYSLENAVKTVIEKINSSANLTIGRNLAKKADGCIISPDVKIYSVNNNSVSSFMGIASDGGKNILLVDDIEFFKDINSLWNKPLGGNLRIVLFNSFGVDKSNPSFNINCHSASAEAWVKSLGFEYVSVQNYEQLVLASERIASYEDKPLFFEIFVS